MAQDLEKQYKLLTNWVKYRLFKEHHGRHLEDCIQHIAMESFKNNTAEDFEKYGLQGKWDWYLANYCRENGLNRSGKSKKSSMTLEMSTFVGLISSEDNDPENYALMENAMMKNHIEQEAEKEAVGELEEILSPIFKTAELYRWAMSHYKRGRFKNE
jgi:hypothetical protein